MSRLENVPQELFDRILSHIAYRFIAHQDRIWIEGTKLCPLRLVSRRLCELTDDIFIDANISVRTVDITTKSLRTLQAILEHRKGYSRSVRKIIIERKQMTSEHYNKLRAGELEVYDNDDGVWNEEVHARNENELAAFEVQKADRIRLESTGRAQHILIQAFRQMPNIQDVEILVPLRHDRGAWYATEQRSGDETRILCNTVLEALTLSNIKLKTLFVGYKWSVLGGYDTVYGFSPHESNALGSKVFDQLEELTITLAFSKEETERLTRYNNDMRRDKATELPQCWLYFTNRVLQFPLKKLDLSWDTAETFDAAEATGFRHSDNVLSILSNGWINTLAHLRLSNLVLHASTLQSFVSLARNGRLRSIQLSYIDVKHGSWHNVIESLRDSLPRNHAVRLIELYHLGQGGMRVDFSNNQLNKRLWYFDPDGDLMQSLNGLLDSMKLSDIKWVVWRPSI
jgi:hypothetical protein